jgi:hypothetical protein
MTYMQAQPKFEPIELEQIHANIGKLMAETATLNAEAGKFSREKKMYLMMVIAGLIGATGTAAGVALTFWLKF